MPTLEFTGKSGTRYEYEVHPVGSHLDDVAGNYIFTKAAAGASGEPTHVPIFVGQTGHGFNNRLESHEAAACIREKGATHVCVHRNADEAAREAEAADIREALQPSCNAPGERGAPAGEPTS